MLTQEREPLADVEDAGTNSQLFPGMTLLSSGPGYFSCWTALNQCSVVFFTDPASSKKDCMMNCSDCAAVSFKACTEDTDDQLVDT